MSINRLPKFWLLLLAVVPLYLTWTFDHSLWNPDETRDAGIAAEMFRTGQYAVPHLNGEAFLEKPPLYYWTCAAVYKLTGRVTAGTTRFPSALYGILGIIFTFLIGRRLFNERTGFFAAAMLATTSQYFRMSHFAMMDVSLAALVTGALYFHVRGSKIGFIIFTILAFYAKGFLGVILPGLVVIVDDLMEKKPAELAKTIGLGAVLFAVFCLPWFWTLWKQGGSEYLKIFFIDNHWNRFVANGSDHTEHFWFYYLLTFPVDFLPWSLFFCAFLWFFFKDMHGQLENRSKRFVLVWFFVFLAFFTLSSSKRSIYLLPLFPAACLLTASWLDEGAPPSVRCAAAALSGIIALFLVGGSLAFVKKLDQDKTFVPLCEAVQANSTGKVIAGYDLSEMEQGVFSFYLQETFLNFKSREAFEKALNENPAKAFLLIVNRNRMADIAGNEKMKRLFEYRPGKKTRSYLLYENTHR